LNPLTTLRLAAFVVLFAAAAVAGDNTSPTYRHGAITGWTTEHYVLTDNAPGKTIFAHKPLYQLEGAEAIYEIDDCGSLRSGAFETGQAVEYRVSGKKLFIREQNAKELKCRIESVKTAAH